jgi:hypothetical protein
VELVIFAPPPYLGTTLLLYLMVPDQKTVPNLEDVNSHPPNTKRPLAPEEVELGTFVHLLVMLLSRLETL